MTGRGPGESEPGARVDGRLAALRGRLSEEGLDGFLTRHAPNVRYLSGFTGSAGALLVTPDASFLLTDSRYEEQAGEEVRGSEVRLRVASDGVRELLGELAGEAGLADGEGEADPSPAAAGADRRLGFEAERLSVAELARIREAVPGVEWEATEGIAEGLRVRKDDGEMASIRRAARTAVRTFERTLAVVEEGMTELELVAELEYRLRMEGSGAAPFETIVASGPRSALPHARPSERRLTEGDLLLLDFGATHDGYCSDMSRTVVLGAASDWQREAHGAARDAGRAARDTIAPGVEAREVDRAARSLLEERGYADSFGHSTGHGIGLEVHEDPALSSRSEDILQEGHVVTVEPGVYLPGWGGVRVEDDVVVERDGARVLTDCPRHLREL